MHHDLMTKYREPHRHYHNENHIYHVLNELTPTVGKISNELYIAAWYHDAIYDPKSKTNEIDSVQYLKETFDLIPITFDITKVIVMITDTINHKPTIQESRALIRADLSILVCDNFSYMEYAKNIRKEYEFVNIVDYVAKRKQVLEGLEENVFELFPSSKHDFHHNTSKEIEWLDSLVNNKERLKASL